jgi:hypothetical protein
MALHKRTYNPGIWWNGVGNNYSYNNVTNFPHNCFLGGGNAGTPWGAGWAGIASGDGSECLFEANVVDTCAYECGAGLLTQGGPRGRPDLDPATP